MAHNGGLIVGQGAPVPRGRARVCVRVRVRVACTAGSMDTIKQINTDTRRGHRCSTRVNT